MKRLVLSSLFIFSAIACTATRVHQIEVSEFTVNNAARFDVVFFKTKGKGFDVSLNGSSLTGSSLVIRKDEISCGRGATIGVIRGFGRIGNDPYLMLPGESKKEFHVYCGNDDLHKAEGKYYVKIKNIYTSNVAGQPEKVIASNVLFELK